MFLLRLEMEQLFRIDTPLVKAQLALFSVVPKLISNRATFWLRDIVSSAHFAGVYYYGDADCNGASYSGGVRPVFAIGWSESGALCPHENTQVTTICAIK